MAQGNVRDRSAGLAAGQEQVMGFSKATGIDSHSYFAPGSKIFYVDPNNVQATDPGNLGEDPTVPLATIAAAIVLCRDHMGDTIIVGGNDRWQHAPHNRNTPILESVIIPSTKGGIRIVGAASNPMGVTWSPTANSGIALRVRAIDILVEGFTFFTAFANCTAIYAEYGVIGVTSYGDNLTVRNCFFDDVLDYGIRLDFSWYAQIHDNHFEGTQIAAINSVDATGDPDYANIHDNTFMDATAAIDLEDSSYCFIHGNRIFGNPAGVANFIDTAGGNNNMVTDNYLACSIAQYAAGGTCVGGGSDMWVFNHCNDGEPNANP